MRPSRAWIGAVVAFSFVACSRGPASIDVSPKKVKIYGIDRAQRMTSRILDKKGQLLEGSPEWSSSNAEVVAAEPGGRLVAKGAGRATVTAKYKEIQTQVAVEVVDISTIDLATPALSLIGPPGTSIPMSCSVKDSKGKMLDLKPTWISQNPAVATVSEEGLVTSIAAGKTTIQVIAYGTDGIAIPEVAAAFKSSNPAVASVDSAGVASGKTAGATTVRVELAGSFAEATLLVN